MTNSITKIGFLLLLISTLISCSSKTKIEINFDSSQKGILVFDNQDTVKIVGDSVLVYEINSGVHKFILNKDKEQTVDIADQGGILNLNKKRYVRIYQDYKSETESQMDGIMSSLRSNYIENDIVIIDSTVYIYRKDTIKEISDEQIKIAIKNYNSTKKDKNSYEDSSDLRLFEADLFIPKKWDYGLTEDFPPSIEIRTTNSNAGSEVKTKIVRQEYFVIAAILSPNNFIVKNEKAIMSNVNDKKVDDAKKKHQLDF